MPVHPSPEPDEVKAPKVVRRALVVPGFRACGIHCGIKAEARDLALIASVPEAIAAGVFTRSSVVGAPVELCRERLRSGRGCAVVVNSGVANVAMGARGRRDAECMAGLLARELGCVEERVFVASTGVIGEPLPMARLREGIPRAVAALRPNGLAEAAEAIRTTDTRAKLASTRLRLPDGTTLRIAGIAKGSGMIQPDMATMLSFLVSDVAVSPRFLQSALRRVCDSSFNRLTVDGETSTSDSVLCFANGLAGNARLTSRRSPGAEAFEGALRAVAEDLARQLARDGEGATKLVTVRVRGARSDDEAERAARRVANSMLVKTALFGGDPNWGRILQAIGAGRIAWSPKGSRISLCGVDVFAGGASKGRAARNRAARRMAAEEVTIELDLGVGRASAHVWTCDLSFEYVRINAEYTT